MNNALILDEKNYLELLENGRIDYRLILVLHFIFIRRSNGKYLVIKDCNTGLSEVEISETEMFKLMDNMND